MAIKWGLNAVSSPTMKANGMGKIHNARKNANTHVIDPRIACESVTLIKNSLVVLLK
ncbi:hypothetical protein DSCW_06870 [Desulfosarcina widdelii]|uniref:Uncharacterized protein n=1 Tax=Desulfosarcina widdelii TaxID=947919 RepID=A0A5K7YY45_9BACT|nr:hypothetical protein DSCW_06870 [Desulfosarcina widdelii]